MAMTLMSAVLPKRTTTVGKNKVQTEICHCTFRDKKETYVVRKLITSGGRGSITDN